MATAKHKTQTINIGDQAIQVAQLKAVDGTAVDVSTLTTAVTALEAIAANGPVELESGVSTANDIIAALVSLGLATDIA